MEHIKNYIIKQLAAKQLSEEEAKKMLMALGVKPVKAEEGIAIIGMACKFPGAKNVEEYWNNLVEEVNCITGYPEDRRKDIDPILANPAFGMLMYDMEYDNGTAENQAVEFAKTGYLEDVDKFDAGFFHMTPREAKFVDPLHRLFLETAVEAIEDGGYGGKKIYGTKTGVFVGRDNSAYSNYSMITENDPMHLTGSYAGMLATRLSYIYDLKGPGMVIDTACSSGAVAIHQACRALKNNECDYAIASGVNYLSRPKIKGRSKMEMVESSDGTVRTFDKNANGTVWGEGVGVLLLKKLSRAIADKDNIYAVIKGSAINNDGASNGITAPNAEAQEEVIVQAWKDANINPETLSYIEAHGTGTVLGDPIEIKGLESAFARFTDRKQFCGIGSVKPNMGHLVSASCLASVIKVVLSLKKGIIPASINFDLPNPYINFCSSPVYICDKPTLWNKGDKPRRAGISSFGFSGTNCHIVVEEAPKLGMQRLENVNETQILTLSARNEKIVSEYINRFDRFLSKEENINLCDLCYTANTGRNHFEHRIAFVVSSIDELKQKLALAKENSALGNLNVKGISYNHHHMVPNNKKLLEQGDITEEEKSRLSRKAFELISHGFEDEHSFDGLCKLYTEGAEVEWDKLYMGKPFKRISLPAYPFERVRLWAEPRKIDKQALFDTHPLFDDKGISSLDRFTFTTTFNINKHWVLSDHKIMGSCVVPGTTYLEMAREAATAYYMGQNVELRDVIFLTPLVVGEAGAKVQTIIKNENDHLEFVIASESTDSNYVIPRWSALVEGKIYPTGNEATQTYRIDTLKEKCCAGKVEYDANGKNERGINGPFEFGDRWNNISSIFTGKDEALVLLSLPDKFYSDTEKYYIHPALIDNAVNALSQSIGDGVHLPLSYKRIKLYRKMPGSFYSYLRVNENKNESTGTISFDIVLLTEEGDIIAEIKDYIIKRIQGNEFNLKGLSASNTTYYDIEWVEADNKTQVLDGNGGSVLLLADGKGASNTIFENLVSAGRQVFLARLGEDYEKLGAGKYTVNGSEDDYRKLLADIKREGKIIQIVHMLTMSPDRAEEDMLEFEQSKIRGLYSLFRLTKALITEGYNHEINLVLIAENVNIVTAGDKQIRPLNAALFGLGRVISQEYPNIKCSCIDIDNETDLNGIFSELLSARSAYCTAYRNSRRYEPCFSSFEAINDNKPETIKLDEKGVYIITGGTGGIGLETAKYLSSKSKLNLALVNRTAMPDRENWDEILEQSVDKKLCRKINTILDIEKNGTNIICVKSDVSDENQVIQLIEDLKAGFGKINGIIHSAGVAGDGFVLRKDEKVFNQVIDPKINGAWLLHKATIEEEVEFFVVFSSVATLVPAAGQGDYTAANSYLDAFAAYRSLQGKKTLAINWPAWNETGMAVEHGLKDNDTLFRSISTERALGYLDALLKSTRTRAYVGDLNYKVLYSLKDELPVRMSQSVRAAVEKYGKGMRDVKNLKKDITIKGISEDEMDTTKGRVARIWAQVFDIQEIDVYADFYDMGGDSILAAQLLKEIDKYYPSLIGITDVFSYPSIMELAYTLDERIGQQAAEETVEEDLENTFDKLLDSIETGNMSIEEGLNFIKGERSGERE